jgi:amino acid transporter
VLTLPPPRHSALLQSLGLYIFVEGVLLLFEYLDPDKDMTVGFVVVDFQMASFLGFVGLLLLIGIVKNRERFISLYLLLSSLIWFIVTTLAVSYMIFYNTTQELPRGDGANATVEVLKSGEPTPTPPPKETVPVEKAALFSIGLIVFWCGQLGVYKFHDQVIEKNVINAGESYVTSALHSKDG